MYDTHLILSHANPSKHGRISCIPRTTEQYVSFRIGNLLFKDSMQFLNKGLDGLVASLKKSQLSTTAEFFKNYTKKITDDPTLIDTPTLGLYNLEVPGETFEVAKEKKKKSVPANTQPPLPSSSPKEGPTEPKRKRNNFILEEVDVEDEEDIEGK